MLFLEPYLNLCIIGGHTFPITWSQFYNLVKFLYLIQHKALFPSKKLTEGFSGGAVVKNPPTNAGDTGLSPGPGRSHMPQGT